MKKFLFLFALLLAFQLAEPGAAVAQEDPVKWTLKLVSKTATIRPGDMFDLEIQAEIRPPWHLYSTTKIENGPIATSIALAAGQPFEQIGALRQPSPTVEFDRNFNVDTEYFERSARFGMTVNALAGFSTNTNKLTIKTRYQSCTSEMCLPPKVDTLDVIVPIDGTQAVAQASAGGVKTSTPSSGDNSVVPDFEFTDFAGKKRKFSEFKGKVVLIDFWATWCGPCLADIPKLKKLYEKYNSEGFEILAMNAETIGDEDPDPAFAKEAAKRARQIVTTRGAVWTQADAATSLPVAVNTFGVKALPTKVLIGRDGKVIAVLREKDDTEKAVADAMAQK